MQDGIRQPQPNDLDWLAFLYVSGEMPAEQLASFEARLADDQAARQAVASAVELVQALAAAESQDDRQLVTLPQRLAAWSRRIKWMSVGAAAALVLVLAWLKFDSLTSWFAAPKPDHRELAEVWSQTRQTVQDIVVSPGERNETESELDLDQPAVSPLPSWIAAAVLGQDGHGETDADGDGIPDEAWENERGEN
jgi:ferric-dicitrate binding protein FerR (iron transport regulator)